MGKKEIGSSEKIWGKYVQGHTDNKWQPLDLNHGLNIHALNRHDYKFRNSEFLNPKRVMFFTSPILTSPVLYTQSCPITTCSVWVLERGWVAWRRVVEVEERGRKRNRTYDSRTEQNFRKKRNWGIRHPPIIFSTPLSPFCLKHILCPSVLEDISIFINQLPTMSYEFKSFSVPEGTFSFK